MPTNHAKTTEPALLLPAMNTFVIVQRVSMATTVKKVGKNVVFIFFVALYALKRKEFDKV